MSGNQSEMGYGGSGHVTSLPNSFSPPINALTVGPSVTTLSGATVAGTSNLKTLLNVTGSKSRLNALAFAAADSTTRDVRMVITVDGTVVFDKTVTSNTASSRVAVGMVTGTSNPGVTPQPVDALNSLKIEFGCSLSETDKLTLSCNYEVR